MDRQEKRFYKAIGVIALLIAVGAYVTAKCYPPVDIPTRFHEAEGQ